MQKTTPMDDIPRLVEAAKDDPAAFGRLYSHYVQPIYRYLYSQVGTIHDAEDLGQSRAAWRGHGTSCGRN